MQCSLVSFYGRKNTTLHKYLEQVHSLIYSHLKDAFYPYSIEQIHGTIIGLETEKIGDQSYSKWCLQNNIQKGPINKKGLLKCLQEDIPIQNIRIGGFKPGIDYGFLSRENQPYHRSFSTQGNTMVLNGWPGYLKNGQWMVTNDLYRWRNQMETFNFCHKYNTLGNQDNDLFMVLGRFNSDKITVKIVDELSNSLRDIISKKQIIIPLNFSDISVVEYKEPELPLASTRICPISNTLFF